MQKNHTFPISEIEYIPVDDEREQIVAAIELLLKQIERMDPC